MQTAFEINLQWRVNLQWSRPRGSCRQSTAQFSVREVAARQAGRQAALCNELLCNASVWFVMWFSPLKETPVMGLNLLASGHAFPSAETTSRSSPWPRLGQVTGRACLLHQLPHEGCCLFLMDKLTFDLLFAPFSFDLPVTSLTSDDPGALG